MDLEVTEEDICELVESHNRALYTQELVELPATEQQASLEEEDPGEEQLPTTELKELLEKWQFVKDIAQRYHPDKALAREINNKFAAATVFPFRRLLKRRQKQLTMERFLPKRPRQEEEPAASTSGAQLPSSSSSSSS